MTYGYIRVSTDKQTVENQRYEVVNFAEKNGIKIDSWIEETVSGCRDPGKRKLGALLEKLQKGDLLICSELSRIGRSMLMIMGILNECMRRDVQVWTIKDGFKLGDGITAKVLAFAFGLVAELERDLISKRTREAVARKRAEGVTLGRPRGRKSARVKCTGRECEIASLFSIGLAKKAVAAKIGVNRNTLRKFMGERMSV